MPSTTSNQGRVACTMGTRHVAVATDPDLCYVPGNSKAQPFPNTARTMQLAEGATWRTLIDDERVWTKVGRLGPPSDPEHEGTNKGMFSRTYRGEAWAASWSLDVWFEGEQLIRCYDATDQNCANTQGIVVPEELVMDVTMHAMLPPACAYLHPKVSTFGWDANFTHLNKVVLQPPAGVDGTHEFPGAAARTPAKTYEATINGRAIKFIVAGTSPAAGHQVPSIDQLMNSFALLPDAVLQGVTTVVVSPNRCPEDERIARERHLENFRSAATMGGGTMTFYPLPFPELPERVVNSITIHEGGHALSDQLWRDDAAKARWEAARQADKYPVSKYAGATVGEDFAESYLMHMLTKNTQCEAYARYFYPNRYRVLDALFAPPPAATP